MKLKKIELFGFKSFADKVVLDFHEGITCVVGPNGCGKSNIADAMRWVFGEQSVKSMRGDKKMVDLIFAGTTTRKALNLAEVTITFSEINGALPIEYDEVSVTRRLHRSGESDYLINRQPVRLKDVQEIFLDSGIGRAAFSIFEQGKIDQMIQATPEERRDPFEKAAGVERYLMRKKEALRKFEQVDQNLTRVKDICAEVTKQIAVLEEQAQKAKIFQEEKKRFEALEKGYLAAQIKNLMSREQELTSKQGHLTQALSGLQTEESQTTAKLQAQKSLLSQEEETLRIKNEELHAKHSEKRLKQEGLRPTAKGCANWR